MFATLRIERSGAPAQSLEIENRPLILDAASADVPLGGRSGAGRCKVEMVGSQLLVTDLGTPGGVFARGQRIERLALDPGEAFFVGDARVTFDLGRASAPTVAANGTVAAGAIRTLVAEGAPGRHALLGVAPPVTPARDAPVDSPASPGAPPSIEGYTILRRLGEGSTGVAYLARSAESDASCVIKTIDFEGKSQAAIFFIREAQTGLRMNHPNVVRVLDFGEAGGLLFLAMEYLEGGSLRERIDRAGRLSNREAVDHLIQLAGALEHAGRRKFVHRDIKPANILLTADGIPKLADWGLAKMLSQTEHLKITHTGDSRGTPMYMAPEVVLDASRSDQRSDIYSLGATYYHALAGEPPFAPTSIGEVLENVLEAEPAPLEARNPAVPSGLAAVIRRMMCKSVEDRYPDPAALLRDLEALGGR
jgi:predicted Ser/Thr protein kinase